MSVNKDEDDGIHKGNVLRDLSPELRNELVESLERVLLKLRLGVREKGECASGGGLGGGTHGVADRAECVLAPDVVRVSSRTRDASATHTQRFVDQAPSTQLTPVFQNGKLLGLCKGCASSVPEPASPDIVPKLALSRCFSAFFLSTTTQSLTTLTMSFVIRRAAQRAAPRARGFATDAGKGSYHEQQQAMIAHAAGVFNSFRNVTIPS